MIIREVTSGKKDLAMARIDYKKTYDMVSHLWIKVWLELFGVSENNKILLANNMEQWRVMLCTGN